MKITEQTLIEKTGLNLIQLQELQEKFDSYALTLESNLENKNSIKTLKYKWRTKNNFPTEYSRLLNLFLGKGPKSSTEKSREYRARQKALGNKLKQYKYEKEKRPSNISPDYSRYIETDGKFDKAKAKDLAERISYQFEIYYSEMTFFTKKGEQIVTKEFSVIKPYILKNRIDLSKGIYINKRHHRLISRKSTRYNNYSDVGLYFELKKYVNKGYKIWVKHNDGTKYTIYSERDLYLKTKSLPYDGLIFAIEKEPQNKDSDMWNPDYNGSWLRISSISTVKQIKDYRVRLATNNIKRNYTFPNAILNKEKKRQANFKRRYNFLSEEISKENIKDHKCFIQEVLTYPGVFTHKNELDLKIYIKDLLSTCSLKESIEKFYDTVELVFKMVLKTLKSIPKVVSDIVGTIIFPTYKKASKAKIVEEPKPVKKPKVFDLEFLISKLSEYLRNREIVKINEDELYFVFGQDPEGRDYGISYNTSRSKLYQTIGYGIGEIPSTLKEFNKAEDLIKQHIEELKLELSNSI